MADAKEAAGIGERGTRSAEETTTVKETRSDSKGVTNVPSPFKIDFAGKHDDLDIVDDALPGQFTFKKNPAPMFRPKAGMRPSSAQTRYNVSQKETSDFSFENTVKHASEEEQAHFAKLFYTGGVQDSDDTDELMTEEDARDALAYSSAARVILSTGESKSWQHPPHSKTFNVAKLLESVEEMATSQTEPATPPITTAHNSKPPHQVDSSTSLQKQAVFCMPSPRVAQLASTEAHRSSPSSLIPSTNPHTEPADSSTTAQIQFRHSGGRIFRRFNLDEPVRRIYEWQKATPLDGQEGVAFELISMGTNLIDFLDMTIAEAGLNGNTVMIEHKAHISSTTPSPDSCPYDENTIFYQPFMTLEIAANHIAEILGKAVAFTAYWSDDQVITGPRLKDKVLAQLRDVMRDLRWIAQCLSFGMPEWDLATLPHDFFGDVKAMLRHLDRQIRKLKGRRGLAFLDDGLVELDRIDLAVRKLQGRRREMEAESRRKWEAEHAIQFMSTSATSEETAESIVKTEEAEGSNNAMQMAKASVMSKDETQEGEKKQNAEQFEHAS